MLEGKHINLRLFREEDLEEYLTLDSKFNERGDFPSTRFRSPAVARREFKKTGWWEPDVGRMLITAKDGRMLGIIVYFKPYAYRMGYEIGYGLFQRKDWGHGYVTEALRIFSAYLFEDRPIPRLQVCMVPDHVASRRVAEKAGYQHEGLQRKVGFQGGVYHDLHVLSLVREECPRLAEVLAG